MKALFFADPRQIEYRTVDDPKPEDAASAIVKVELCAICGSDLLSSYRVEGAAAGRFAGIIAQR